MALLSARPASPDLRKRTWHPQRAWNASTTGWLTLKLSWVITVTVRPAGGGAAVGVGEAAGVAVAIGSGDGVGVIVTQPASKTKTIKARTTTR